MTEKPLNKLPGLASVAPSASSAEKLICNWAPGAMSPPVTGNVFTPVITSTVGVVCAETAAGRAENSRPNAASAATATSGRTRPATGATARADAARKRGVRLIRHPRPTCPRAGGTAPGDALRTHRPDKNAGKPQGLSPTVFTVFCSSCCVLTPPPSALSAHTMAAASISTLFLCPGTAFAPPPITALPSRSRSRCAR